MADEKQPEGPNRQLNIELSEEVAEGVYANLAMIAHSNTEFIIDFIRMMPGIPKARVKSRVIVTPEHARRLLDALTENIERYEAAHGLIKSTESGTPAFPMNFGGTVGQA
ncbi:MAG: DUF3467 domain-containing protein [Catalinimonas sp.]